MRILKLKYVMSPIFGFSTDSPLPQSPTRSFRPTQLETPEGIALSLCKSEIAKEKVNKTVSAILFLPVISLTLIIYLLIVTINQLYLCFLRNNIKPIYVGFKAGHCGGDTVDDDDDIKGCFKKMFTLHRLMRLSTLQIPSFS